MEEPLKKGIAAQYLKKVTGRKTITWKFRCKRHLNIWSLYSLLLLYRPASDVWQTDGSWRTAGSMCVWKRDGDVTKKKIKIFSNSFFFLNPWRRPLLCPTFYLWLSRARECIPQINPITDGARELKVRLLYKVHEAEISVARGFWWGCWRRTTCGVFT